MLKVFQHPIIKVSKCKPALLFIDLPCEVPKQSA
jgi:hypothetical protein